MCHRLGERVDIAFLQCGEVGAISLARLAAVGGQRGAEIGRSGNVERELEIVVAARFLVGLVVAAEAAFDSLGIVVHELERVPAAAALRSARSWRHDVDVLHRAVAFEIELDARRVALAELVGYGFAAIRAAFADCASMGLSANTTVVICLVLSNGSGAAECVRADQCRLFAILIERSRSVRTGKTRRECKRGHQTKQRNLHGGSPLPLVSHRSNISRHARHPIRETPLDASEQTQHRPATSTHVALPPKPNPMRSGSRPQDKACGGPRSRSNEKTASLHLSRLWQSISVIARLRRGNVPAPAPAAHNYVSHHEVYFHVDATRRPETYRKGRGSDSERIGRAPRDRIAARLHGNAEDSTQRLFRVPNRRTVIVPGTISGRARVEGMRCDALRSNAVIPHTRAA